MISAIIIAAFALPRGCERSVRARGEVAMSVRDERPAAGEPPGTQGAYERALEWLWTHRHDGEQYRAWIRQRISGLRFLRGES